MGLSEAQATSVKGTWKKVAENLKDHAVKIFVKFLSDNPEQQAFFKKFEVVAKEDLAGNEDVSKHAMVVMTALGEYIDVIDNADSLKKAVKPVAESHKPRKITLPNFQKMFPVIVDYVVTNVDGDKEAWTTALETIGTAISTQQ
ncbi:globin-like [Gigantopelta aegis]|uniref:globin-like n=1 Tax=Gigantopelta aegis TaxID=1735272 RepID=UPI001B8881BF|nr:globin-like [Gigantopelta aegis]